MSRQASRSNVFFLALSVFLYAGSSADWAEASEISVPDGTVLDFSVMREGEKIGTHIMKFTHSGDHMGVEIKTDIQVSILFVPVYHFNHEGQEVWQGGKLKKLDSNTDDDGTKHTLSVEGRAAALNINGDGNLSTANSAMIPASLWHPGFMHPGQAKILNTLDGRIMTVNTTFKGDEKVAVHSATVLAKHFAITGDLEREVWYDPNGMLAKTRFKGSDGSVIEYVLK